MRGKRSRLRVSNLLKAAATAEQALPELVAMLVAEAKDPKHKLKDRTGAVRAVMSAAEMSPRLTEHLGLDGPKGGGGHDSPLLAIIGSNVNVLSLRNMDPDARQKALLEALGGNTAPLESAIKTLSSPDVLISECAPDTVEGEAA